MPLPQPNLDDKTFEALVEEAVKLIPRDAPEWTDHNRHDPGITLVELFAWLAEMQHYYLNRVPEANYLKFLKLLGTKLREAQPARAEATFTPPPDQGVAVPRRTKLVGEAGMVFETADPLLVIPARIKRVATITPAVVKDQTDANDIEGLSFYAFDETAALGNKLYLGIERVPLFEWEKVAAVSKKSRQDSEDARLLNYLSRRFNLSWVKQAQVSKPNSHTIKISFGGSWLILALDDTPPKVTLVGSGGEKATFIVREEKGSHVVYSSGQPLPVGETFAVSFNMFEDYPVARGSHGDEEAAITPSAIVAWEYLKDEGGKDVWTPLDIIADLETLFARLSQKPESFHALCSEARGQLLREVQALQTFKQLAPDAQKHLLQRILGASRTTDLSELLTCQTFLQLKGDETLMLSQSGRIFFTAPAAMKARPLHPIREELYWLRAVVRQAGYEVPPQVDTINLNTAPVMQQETISEAVSFDGTGKANQVFRADSFLAVYGTPLVQVRGQDGRWRDWERKNNLNSSGPTDAHYRLRPKEAEAILEIEFGDGLKGRIPPAGKGNIRLVACLPEFEAQRLIGRSNGLPGQSFALTQSGVMPNDFALQIEERADESPFTTEEVTVDCLLSFRRTTPTRVTQAGPFKVKVELEAKHELCSVRITERCRGGVQIKDAQPVFTRKKLREGEVVSFEYEAQAVSGGAIFGEISLTFAAHCPAQTYQSPVSYVEFGDAPQVDTRWRDFTRVDDFDASGSTDPHFTLDPLTGEIIFGDGETGRIPQSPEDETRENIRVIAYRTTAADRGNVLKESLTKMVEPFGINLAEAMESLRVVNRRPASGGALRETLEEAKTRVRRDLKTQYQAVTSDDYEYLARATPGLRVARSKAIPLYKPGMTGYPESEAPACVTVVVVPYAPAVKPIPSEAFLKTVCRHLDKHRLVTTKVYVIPPDYVEVSVQATISPKTGFEAGTVVERVVTALNNFLRPLPVESDPRSTGWPFGRTVFKSEIYQVIELVEGVDCVERVVLTAVGKEIARDADGNILIPPQALVVPGTHRIEVMFSEEECRRAR
ncbi:MAG TPA: putative baseplate assembly protein [Pyrinomonadaceae bacterium]|nr:putative baseplate assembly protein [Pyrinomonadaceae bacterium]